MSSTRVFSMSTLSTRVVARLAAVAVAGAAFGCAGVAPASATNEGTVSGNQTSGCAVNWNAHTIMDADGVANLDTDLNGNAVHYSNGGYASEISPPFKDPGFMEIQHWMGNPNDPNSIHWRIPVATTHDIRDATLTIALPADHGYQLNTTEDLASWIMRWEKGHTYTNVKPESISSSGDTATVDLGDLKAGTGVILWTSSGRFPPARSATPSRPRPSCAAATRRAPAAR